MSSSTACAARFIVRRGRLTGCIVNKGFVGSGDRLKSGTLAPDVTRERKDPAPVSADARAA